jgi:hypothetical protein
MAENQEKKKAKKNIISDKINRAIPILKPALTGSVWCLPTLPSIITSFHQLPEQNIKETIPNISVGLENA